MTSAETFPVTYTNAFDGPTEQIQYVEVRERLVNPGTGWRTAGTEVIMHTDDTYEANFGDKNTRFFKQLGAVRRIKRCTDKGFTVTDWTATDCTRTTRIKSRIYTWDQWSREDIDADHRPIREAMRMPRTVTIPIHWMSRYELYRTLFFENTVFDMTLEKLSHRTEIIEDCLAAIFQAAVDEDGRPFRFRFDERTAEYDEDQIRQALADVFDEAYADRIRGTTSRTTIIIPSIWMEPSMLHHFICDGKPLPADRESAINEAFGRMAFAASLPDDVGYEDPWLEYTGEEVRKALEVAYDMEAGA
jgi:hypothetical protein